MDQYTASLAADFQRFVRGDITEQEWICRESLVIMAITSQPTAGPLVAVA